MAKVVDPDQLNQGTEVVIDTGAKTVQLLVAGNLDDSAPGQSSGVALQCLYSFLKEEWLSDTALNKFKFPLKAIYEAKFIWQNGWEPADDQTRDLIRDAGWKEIDDSEYACIISLGEMDDDQVDLGYYQQEAGFDKTTTAFDKTGELDEAIQVFDGGSNDYRDFLKVYLREEQKTFALSNLLVDQNLAALTFIAYRLPLANANDIKVTHADAYIEANVPYTGMSIDYLKGTKYETWSAGTYYQWDVVYHPTNERWWRCTAASTTEEPTGTPSDWEAFPGERQIGTAYYAFNRIVDGNGGTIEEVYEFCQHALRQLTDINDDTGGDAYGTVYGNVAVPLCAFVGDVQHTNPGCFVDDFDVNDKNSIVFHDITVDGGLDSEDVPIDSTERTFPFVSAGSIKFDANIVGEDDANTLYRMYFKNANGNEFDTADAIVVNDNNNDPIQGEVTGATVNFDFDYDNNAQGGRTPATNADVVVVAQGLNDAEWNYAEFTITRTTGLSFPVPTPDERNYANPT